MADALVEVFDGAVVERDLVGQSADADDGPADATDAARHPTEAGQTGTGGDPPDTASCGTRAPASPPSLASPPSPSSSQVPQPSGRPTTYPALSRSGSKDAARTAVIITVDAHTMESELLGSGPISTDELIDVLAGPRTDLYAAVRDVRGAILKFGRSRRLASPLQRLALALRDRGCIWTGCAVRWDRCDADHEPPREHGGRTDLDQLRHLCTNEHHPHRHETGANASRIDGGWTINVGTGARAAATIDAGAPP